MINLHSLKHNLDKNEREKSLCIEMDGDVYMTAEDASYKFLHSRFVNLKRGIIIAVFYPLLQQETYWIEGCVWYSQSSKWYGRGKRK